MLNTKKLASSVCLTLGLGLVITPQGCGGDTPIPQVPATLAGQFKACAAEHRRHLGEGAYSIGFDVNFADGQVDLVALRDSTLGDQELELCLVSALRSFSEDDLLALRAEDRPRAPVAPASRALLGFPQAAPAAAACAVSLPCVLTVVFLMGASYITVTLFVQGTSKHWPSLAKPQTGQPTKPAQDPKAAGDPNTTGPTPPVPPLPDCPRNENFIPDHTDDARGCIDKKGDVRCYSRKHRPCAGVHTHGILKYQKIRSGVCKEVADTAVRCEGPFIVVGLCGSVPTVECREGGPEISGVFLEK